MPYRAAQDTQFIGAFGELTAAEELRVQEIQALADTDTDEALGKTAGSIVKKEVIGGVASVNGQTGTVVLDADDIDDTSTTNKFTSSTEKSTWDNKANFVDILIFG